MLPSPPSSHFDFSALLPVLEERGILPPDGACVYSAGSLVLGWGNATSDADYFVVTEKPWTGTWNRTNPTSAESESGLSYSLTQYVGDRRVDVDYWTEAQIDQLIAHVSWENYDRGFTVADLVTNHDFEVLQRLGHARALHGDDWLRGRQAMVERSALRALTVSRYLSWTDAYIEDAEGSLAVGDFHTAVLAARIAFGYATDGLLSSLSGVGGNTPANKWRARHLLSVNQSVISFDEYWEIETMVDYADDRAAQWVERVVSTCRAMCEAVSIS